MRPSARFYPAGMDVVARLRAAADDVLSTRLSGLLAHRASAGPINGIVVLNEAPLRLAGRILRDKVIIYSSDEPARVAYEVRTGKLAMDFEIHAAPLDRALPAAMAAKARPSVAEPSDDDAGT